MPNHILRHHELMVFLPIVNLELEANEGWKDRCGAGLGFDGWWRWFAWLCFDDWETDSSLVWRE